MKLIVGLGNFGPAYDGTRHNMGFFVVDKLSQKLGLSGLWNMKDRFKTLIAETTVNDEKIILIKPTTFYNLSGEAVQAVKSFYKIDNKDILVVHDELDLPLGEIRSKVGGGSAGNNGIKNIDEHIGSDYTRVRIGVANEKRDIIDASDFVLSKFSTDEHDTVENMADAAITKIEDLIRD